VIVSAFISLTGGITSNLHVVVLPARDCASTIRLREAAC